MSEVTKNLFVPTNVWYGDDKLELTFPESWHLDVVRMTGHDSPPLNDDQIRFAFSNPIGSKKISELAEGKETVVILFDDMSRPTPCYVVVPQVIEELHKGGIQDDNIQFIAAIGNHRVMTHFDYVKKLGAEIVENYPVDNHNPFHNLIEVGTTQYDNRIELNRDFIESDLKIGIGGIKSHGFVGYGGGAKIILPGVSSCNTIVFNHIDIGGFGPGTRPKPFTGPGKVKGNLMRYDMEEAARLGGLDCKVDIVTNNNREPIGVFTGDFVAEHRVGCKFSNEAHSFENMPKEADIVIDNTYPDGSGRVSTRSYTANALKQRGTMVIIDMFPESILPHFLVSARLERARSTRFEDEQPPKLWREPSRPMHQRVGKCILLSNHQSKRARASIGPEEKVVGVKTWEDTLEELKNLHGKEARVAIFPYGRLEHPKYSEEWI
jgi:nickel-dependent lactate racemase